MESITLSALLLLLILVTPALLIIFVFRLFYPKTRTISSSDAKTLLICCIVNLFINGFLLESYLSNFFASNVSQIFSEKPNISEAAKTLLVRDSLTSLPIRPSQFLSKYFDIFNYPPTSFWGLILDLHLRTLLVGLLIFCLFKFVGVLEEVLQAIPYYRTNELRWYHKGLAYFFGYRTQLNDRTNYEQNRIAIRVFGWEPTKFFREAIYHPWAILTRTNRRREILMADVLTAEGSLYSGALSSWVQTDHTVSEVALEYAIRYYPENSSANGQKDTGTEQKKTRKSSFIKNNGEMVIPRERIETLHFWEIRRGFEVAVKIGSDNDLEKLKWFLVLAFVYPKFFARISILVEVPNEKWLKIRSDLGKWLENNRIKFNKDNIVIEIAHQVESQSVPKSP